MSIAQFTESLHPFAFVLSEANGQLSRENGTVLSGEGKVKAGLVVGKVAHAAATSAAFAGNTGNGVMGAVTLGAGAKAGVYKLTILDPVANAGAFLVEDPTGVEVATGKVGTAFAAGGLSFTLADGATDFISGDGFNITVAAGSAKLRAWDPTHTDGSEVIAGVLGYGVDATSADVGSAYLARVAEVNKNTLTFPVGQDTAVAAGLLALGIVVRA